MKVVHTWLDVRFNILGPLECWCSGERLRLGGRVQERVLGALLLDANRAVSVERLVDAGWCGEPPVTAAHQVRKSIAELRRRLPGGAALIPTDGPGYRIDLREDQLDLLVFEARVRRAAVELAAGKRESAAAQLEAALGLWRDCVLAGNSSETLEGVAAALGERRLAAAEQLAGIRLDLGGGGELIGELRRLVAANPLRETLRAQLMRALHQSGRPAEALIEYAKVREYLSQELGVDPSAELAQLHESILHRRPVGV